MTDAFTNLPRHDIVKYTPHACPPLAPLVNSWYTKPSTSVWKDSTDTYHHFTTHRGTTQGCTMSAAIFAISLQPTLHNIQDTINRHLTQHTPPNTQPQRCHLHAYLDDMYIAIPTEHLQHALTTVESRVHDAHLTLNTTKTKMSTTGTPHPTLNATPPPSQSWGPRLLN